MLVVIGAPLSDLITFQVANIGDKLFLSKLFILDIYNIYTYAYTYIREYGQQFIIILTFIIVRFFKINMTVEDTYFQKDFSSFSKFQFRSFWRNTEAYYAYLRCMFAPHREIDPESGLFKPNLDCNYPIPIDWAPNGSSFDAKQSDKGNYNSNLVWMNQIQDRFLCVYISQYFIRSIRSCQI